MLPFSWWLPWPRMAAWALQQGRQQNLPSETKEMGKNEVVLVLLLFLASISQEIGVIKGKELLSLDMSSSCPGQAVGSPKSFAGFTLRILPEVPSEHGISEPFWLELPCPSMLEGVCSGYPQYGQHFSLLFPHTSQCGTAVQVRPGPKLGHLGSLLSVCLSSLLGRSNDHALSWRRVALFVSLSFARKLFFSHSNCLIHSFNKTALLHRQNADSPTPLPPATSVPEMAYFCD